MIKWLVIKLKKNIYILFGSLFLLLSLGIIICNIIEKRNDDDLTTISLGEVTHSAFYAPLYVAMEKGYFEDESIKIDLTLISGANNVTAAVLSGDVEIGFFLHFATYALFKSFTCFKESGDKTIVIASKVACTNK